MSTKKFYKTSLLLGGTYLAIAILNLVKQKIIAHYTGLNGMGILGLVNPYLFMLYSLGSLTIFTAVTKYISEYQAKGATQNLKDLWSTAWTVTFLFSILVTVIFCGFAKSFSSYFLGSESMISYFIIATLCLPFYVIGNLYLSAYKGFQLFPRLAITQFLAALFTVILTMILVAKFNVTGMIYSVTFNWVILALVTIIATAFLKQKSLLTLRFNVNKELFKQLMKFSTTVFSTNLLHYGTQFFIRVQIVRILGMEKNGAIQAAVYFSMYFQIIQDTIMTYLLPRISELQENRLIQQELNTAIRLSGIMTIPVICGFLLLIRQVVDLLLTPDFHVIENIVVYIMIAELVRLLYWNLGTYFLAHRKLKIQFGISVTYSAFYGFFIYIFIQNWDMKGFAIGYLIANLFAFLLTFIYINRMTGFRIQLDNWILIISGIGLMSYCHLIHQTNIWVILISCGFILLWTFLTVRKKEWYYVKEKIFSAL